MEAFLTASEPITVEVLRRKASEVASHRNSVYIPTNGTSHSSHQEEALEDEDILGHDLVEEDLLVPSLYYEVHLLDIHAKIGFPGLWPLKS